MRLTSLGKREIIKYSGLIWLMAAIFIFAGHRLCSCFYGMLILPVVLQWFILNFFRDPKREIPTDPQAILSPADGTITHIEKYQDNETVKGEAWRVSIFLSIFDAHLNRAPFGGTIKEVIYKKGEFFDAREQSSLKKNEANTIVFSTNNSSLPLFAIKQIAGKIARRIVCVVKAGDAVNAGTCVGMMKFSSRTDLIIPADCLVEWKVKIGDKVSAGSTILGCLQ